MTKSDINWNLIDDLAASAGASYWARRKWRQRNHVPHKWRAGLVWWSDGRISFDQFNQLDSQNRGETA